LLYKERFFKEVFVTRVVLSYRRHQSTKGKCFAKPTVPLLLVDEKWGVAFVRSIAKKI
jgi:hypothetical protein